MNTVVYDPARAWLGALLSLTAAASFSVSNGFIKLALHDGVGSIEVVLARFGGTALVLGIMLAIERVPIALPRRALIASIGLGVLLVFYNFSFISSFEYIPIALAVLVFYLFPLLVVVAAWALGREAPSWRAGIAMVVAFAGLALALDIRGASVNLTGALLAFIAAVGLAIVIIANNWIVGAGDARPSTFWMVATAAVGAAIVTAAGGSPSLPDTGHGWLMLAIGTAIFTYAYVGFFVGMSMIGPVRASLLGNVEPVVALAVGWALLGETLGTIQLVGGAIVLAAILVLKMRRGGGH